MNRQMPLWLSAHARPDMRSTGKAGGPLSAEPRRAGVSAGRPVTQEPPQMENNSVFTTGFKPSFGCGRLQSPLSAFSAKRVLTVPQHASEPFSPRALTTTFSLDLATKAIVKPVVALFARSDMLSERSQRVFWLLFGLPTRFEGKNADFGFRSHLHPKRSSNRPETIYTKFHLV